MGKPNPPEKDRPIFFYGYVIVAIAFLTMMLVMGVVYSFGVFFNPLIVEFGWSRTVTSGALSVTAIMVGVMSIMIGNLNDRFGPRRLMTVAGFLMGMGVLLLSRITAAWQLYLFFGVIFGVAAGAPYITQASSVTQWFVKRRGLMIGIFVAGVGAGAMVLPPLAGRLIEAYGWRNAYLILGGVLMVVLMTAAQFMRRSPGDMDLVPHGAVEAAAARDRPEPAPLPLRQLLRSWQLWVSGLIFFAVGLCLMTVMVHLVPLAIDLKISPLRAASLMSLVGATSIVGKLLTGYCVDRFGNKFSLAMGFCLLALALGTLPLAQGLGGLYAFAVIFGFGYGGALVPQPTLVAELFGLKNYGVTLGITEFFLTAGSAVGPLLAGYIFDVNRDYALALYIGAGVAVVGLMLVLRLRPLAVTGAVTAGGPTAAAD